MFTVQRLKKCNINFVVKCKILLSGLFKWFQSFREIEESPLERVTSLYIRSKRRIKFTHFDWNFTPWFKRVPKKLLKGMFCAFSSLYHAGPTMIFRLGSVMYFAHLKLVSSSCSSVMLLDCYAAVLCTSRLKRIIYVQIQETENLLS